MMIACKEKTDYQILPGNETLLVVDAIITNEYKQHEIRLSQTVDKLNAPPEAVSNAKITVSDGDSVFVFTEDSLIPGIYKSTEFSAVTDRYYFLKIEYNGKTYGAETYMIPATPFPEVALSQNDEGLYHIVDNFQSMEDAMWEFYIDWSNTDSSGNSQNQALLYFYTLHTVDVAQVFAENVETIYFPSGTNITQRKYSLSPEYAEFIRTLLSETEWTGGFFDVTPANLSTNLSGGAVGFFAACTVIERKIVVK